MSLSMPTTAWRRSAKSRTVSEPIRPADPVTRTTPTSSPAYRPPAPHAPAGRLAGWPGAGEGVGRDPPPAPPPSRRCDGSGRGMPIVRTPTAYLVVAVGLGLAVGAGAAPINPAGPTTAWTPILYPGTQPDFSNDPSMSGLNREGDIVGNAAHPAFYTAFDDAGTAALTDGMLGFRVRVGTDHIGQPGFQRVATVGIDANLDGDLDLFVIVDNSATTPQIRLRDPGPGANTSPATWSIATVTQQDYAESSGNYSWNQVNVVIDPPATILDLDNDGNVDHFVSFVVPFQDVVNRFTVLGIPNVNQNTPFRYVVATSNATTTLGLDVAGANDARSSLLAWDALNAMSNPYTPAGMPVPEPGTGLLFGLGLFGLARCSRRPTRR